MKPEANEKKCKIIDEAKLKQKQKDNGKNRIAKRHKAYLDHGKHEGCFSQAHH